jgi:hypothetical protein
MAANETVEDIEILQLEVEIWHGEFLRSGFTESNFGNGNLRISFFVAHSLTLSMRRRLVFAETYYQLIAYPLFDKSRRHKRYLFGVDPFQQAFADGRETGAIRGLLQGPGFVYLERAPVGFQFATPQ